MFVAFHTDPIDYSNVENDLQQYGVVYLDTQRTKAREVERTLSNSGAEVICLAVQGPDGDFHHYLLCPSVIDYEGLATNNRILRAILAWQVDGCPLPDVRPA